MDSINDHRRVESLAEGPIRPLTPTYTALASSHDSNSIAPFDRRVSFSRIRDGTLCPTEAGSSRRETLDSREGIGDVLH